VSELPVDTGGECDVSVGFSPRRGGVSTVCWNTIDGSGKSTVSWVYGPGGRQYVDGRWIELPNAILFCGDGGEF
jgi:hypothetical protein